MTYLYSQINRLEVPHNYMYAQFQGKEFLEGYLSSRMAVVNRDVAAEAPCNELDNLLMLCSLPVMAEQICSSSLSEGKKFSALTAGWGLQPLRICSIADERLEQLAKSLSVFNVNERTQTSDLLPALIAVQLVGTERGYVKVWLDRLVQRFEVTKKLYESYPPGFKKGEGDNTSVRLYWQFALALSLYYTRSREIKYLSALLKVCDLLCSLPEDILRGQIPEYGLSLVLAAEVNSVLILAEKKGVSLASQ